VQVENLHPREGNEPHACRSGRRFSTCGKARPGVVLGQVFYLGNPRSAFAPHTAATPAPAPIAASIACGTAGSPPVPGGIRSVTWLANLASPLGRIAKRRTWGGAIRPTLALQSGAIRSSDRPVTGAIRPTAKGCSENLKRLAESAETRFVGCCSTFFRVPRVENRLPPAGLARGSHLFSVTASGFRMESRRTGWFCASVAIDRHKSVHPFLPLSTFH